MDKNDVFQEIRRERGGVANIFSDFTAYPEGVQAHFHLFRQLMLKDGPLPREEREWLAMETSLANESAYCFRHAEEARAHLERQAGKKEITRRQELLSLLALQLSKNMWKAPALHLEFIEAGFTHAEWQHAVMVVAYYNFANRCAEAMESEIEEGFEVICH